MIQRRLGLPDPRGRGLLQRPPPRRPRQLDRATASRSAPDTRPSPPKRWGRGRDRRATMGRMSRISRRVGAIAESATLAVDAKAKALQAAGEDVIGFGAGEPDFPTPAAHRRGRDRGLPRPRATTSTRPRRACPSCGRRSRPRPPATPATTSIAGQVLVTNGGKHAVYNTFQTLLDPGDEVIAARALLDHLPRGDHARRRRAGRAARRPSRAGFRVTVDQLEAARTPRTKVAAVRVAVATRPARSTRRPRSRRSGGGRSSTASGSSPTRSTSTSPTATTSSRRCRCVVPELADTCVVLNGVAKTYAMTGWRVGWMIGPADVIAAATNLQSHRRRTSATSRSAPRSPRCSGDLDAVAEMRAAFDRRGQRHARAARRDPRRHLPRAARARSTASRASRACSAASSAGRTPTTTLELCRAAARRGARSRSCPGEAFGAPGYARLSLRPRRRRPRSRASGASPSSSPSPTPSGARDRPVHGRPVRRACV